MLTNPNMLKSERFRTTVKDPPFAFDFMEGKDVGNKSKQQVEREEFKEIIKQREKMRGNNSMLQMIRADQTPLVQYNKKRNYNDKEEMKRWVGSTID